MDIPRHFFFIKQKSPPLGNGFIPKDLFAVRTPSVYGSDRECALWARFMLSNRFRF